MTVERVTEAIFNGGNAMTGRQVIFNLNLAISKLRVYEAQCWDSNEEAQARMFNAMIHDLYEARDYVGGDYGEDEDDDGI